VAYSKQAINGVKKEYNMTGLAEQFKKQPKVDFISTVSKNGKADSEIYKSSKMVDGKTAALRIISSMICQRRNFLHS
jgi:hypothetical protein